MKILKNILFIILLGCPLLTLTAALLMPEGFYDDLLYPKSQTAPPPQLTTFAKPIEKPIEKTQPINPQARTTQVNSKPAEV